MLLVGIVLVLLNVAALAPLSTNAVPDAVEENFETFPKDQACADEDCTEAESDWASSTSQRDFYGWSVTNLADVMANGTAPTYEKIGPVTYDITTTKTINAYDKTAGTLTYNSVKSFACAEDTEVACDTEVSQLNIAFQPSVIGATNALIDATMDGTKAAFMTGMLAKDLESLAVGAPAAGVVSTNMSQTVAYLETNLGLSAEMAAAAAPALLADNYWTGYAANFALATGGISYNQVNGLHENFSANFTGDPSINMSYAFYDAMGPGGEDLSLTGALGTTMLAGHCSSFPTENATTIMADSANSGTMTRATIWGYMAMLNETIPDFEMTIARDWAMCAGVGMTFAGLGGGDADWMLDESGTAVNAATRLSYLGITMDNTAAMGMLFGAPGDDKITGLLEISEDKTDNGAAKFLANMAAGNMQDAMNTTGIQDTATLSQVATWVTEWFNDSSSLPMILLGGSGDMTASLFVNTSFGAEDPLNGGYLSTSLNIGLEGGQSLWEALGRDAIELDPALSGHILYSETFGLTTQSGAVLFLYGELSGQTPPIFDGNSLPWNETTISTIYGVDENVSSAMRLLMMGDPAKAGVYGTTSDARVPGFLMSIGAMPYLTQSFNSWLLGWQDAATGSWLSLETNETYYGSAGIANGDGTNYTMCTGEVDTCDKGETLLEDGSAQLSWRNDAMYAATYGLITQESLANTTGGFVTGTGDLVDVSGYAIAEISCVGTGTVKNIPVNTCTASVDPTKRSIQANLLETYTLLDATPGALPVYLGSEITMEVEQLSGLIIAGDSTTIFYLDTRAHTNQASEPSMTDLVPVFQIESSSTIGDEDAEEMESAIVTNQQFMTYWTNFDHPIDFLTMIFWLAGICLIMAGMVITASAPVESEEDEMKDHDGAMESAVDDTSEEDAEAESDEDTTAE